MPSDPLLIDLAGVSRLAGVRRPVASMWRSRFVADPHPFPGVVTTERGRSLFDAHAVAEWLQKTGHGNNPDALADAAAYGTLEGFDVTNPAHVATVDAALAVYAALGESLADLSGAEVYERASRIDPGDTCLMSEVAAIESRWMAYVEALSDAAFSPAEASRRLESRHGSTGSGAGLAGPFAGEAEALFVSLVAALALDRDLGLVIHDGLTATLAVSLVERLGEDVPISVPSSEEGRRVRRRLLVTGHMLPSTAPLQDRPWLAVARYPSIGRKSTADVLAAINDLALEMRDGDCALIVAPATVLTDALNGSDATIRTDVLRTGRLRAIVKLPKGLVSTAPRAALAMWVLGTGAEEVPMAERFTGVADLTDAHLTTASIADLTSDVFAATGSIRDLRGHAFRFARLVRTSSLIAARAALVPLASERRVSTRAVHELPALLDVAHVATGEDLPRAVVAEEPVSPLPSASIEQLLSERAVRILAGTRVDPEELTESGLVLIGAGELENPDRVGRRHVDRLTFAARHPFAGYTLPGDVVFCTGPTAAAWVDPDGSKVVAYPARILRIDERNNTGLVPEVIASDIRSASAGPGSWRRWHLRRVSPSLTAATKAAMTDIASRRSALTRRIAALDDYADLLAAGLVAGVVTLTDHAAKAAPDPQ